jgi:5-methylcytosine-specific restriction endonuclease McrA
MSVVRPSELARRERLKVVRAMNQPIGACPTCGSEVSGGRTYCRKQCRRSWQKTGPSGELRRHVLKKGDRSITIAALLERDNGICWLCSAPVLVRRGCQPESASIDHVLPISKGGLHVWDNVRLAHFGCNAYRGNSVA